MKVVMAGQGAFGQRHLEGIKNIPDIEVVSLAGGRPETTQAVAEKFAIPHWTTDLGESLKIPGVEAVILATPTQMHAKQAVQCMEAGSTSRSRSRWPTPSRTPSGSATCRRRPG